ncbi:hypothetical protein NHX12_007116 [Muraenolepis orangiensis]|uniref:Thrombospondin-like N-terminal domain-containing protein n=1 Tax=Muraenolepis orangiensis TaxID=630683 RepID=A0A9Q0ICP2_9TELE|nr:hypothetical protein NHX12_007116 [Muraenolepis orangiensis]
MWPSRLLLLLGALTWSPYLAHTWTPCTDLFPLDLLSRVLPPTGATPQVRGGGASRSQLRMVQSRGSRGFQLSAVTATALSFPASQIFTNCETFPGEFSIVVTLKIKQLAEKRNEYIFSLVQDEGDRLLLGLRVSEHRVNFLVGAGGRRLSFRGIRLADSHWHTLVLAVSGHYATLTVDCGLPIDLVLDQPVLSSFSTSKSRFYVGSRKRWKDRFSGLLRQLVLLPGSDATPRLCPASKPRLADLSVPEVLVTTPFMSDQQSSVFTYEAEVRVTQGDVPPCSPGGEGQLWLNSLRRDLQLCDGHTWTPLLQRPQRLDYVEDYQDVLTSSETFDVEVFSIPGEGLFMAAANRDIHPGSGVFQWVDGRFQLYQNISTQEARAWKHFTLEGQSLTTHSALDWEYFTIQNHSFLAVANHRRARDSNHNIHSVIYCWNPNSKLFEVNQTLPTSGAYDWEFFSVGPYHFLAVANTFDGHTTAISSTIYVWVEGRFITFQQIPTDGATDWEMFQIGERYFLAVANSQRVLRQGPSLYSLNSTIYELNRLTHTFIRFQDLLTHSAVDWEFFSVGEERFLVVANSHDGASYALNSVVYRWQGYEGFVPVHSLPTLGCRDWEFFSTNSSSYLVYSSATSRLSKVFRLKTY